MEADQDSPPPSDERGLLAGMADTAATMTSTLDALRANEFPEIDVDAAARLRTQLDQAAAAALDLHHALRNTVDGDV